MGKISWRRKWQPTQYSFLKNPMDRGVWQTTVHGITKVRHDLASKPPWAPIHPMWQQIYFFLMQISSYNVSKACYSLQSKHEVLIGFLGGWVVKSLLVHAGHIVSIAGSGRFPWGRKWQPTPVFLRKRNHMDRGNWWAIVH